MSDQEFIWDKLVYTPLEAPIEAVDYELLLGGGLEKTYSDFKEKALEWLGHSGEDFLVDDVWGQKFFRERVNSSTLSAEVFEDFWEEQRMRLSQKEEHQSLLKAQEATSTVLTRIRPSKVAMRFGDE